MENDHHPLKMSTGVVRPNQLMASPPRNCASLRLQQESSSTRTAETVWDDQENKQSHEMGMQAGNGDIIQRTREHRSHRCQQIRRNRRMLTLYLPTKQQKPNIFQMLIVLGARVNVDGIWPSIVSDLVGRICAEPSFSTLFTQAILVAAAQELL